MNISADTLGELAAIAFFSWATVWAMVILVRLLWLFRSPHKKYYFEEEVDALRDVAENTRHFLEVNKRAQKYVEYAQARKDVARSVEVLDITRIRLGVFR